MIATPDATARIDEIIKGSIIEPRPYQRTIVGKSVNMFNGDYVNGGGDRETAARSVMVESPTGSGKTVMGFMTAAILKKENPNLAIGWCAMRRDLLRQAAKANKELGLNVPDIEYVSMFDKNPEGLVQARKDGRDILLVVDEAQHDAANSMAHLHNIIEPDKILGLTATPFRTDRVKLCFDKVVKDAGIHQLIQDGYLSRYDHYTIPKWDPQTVSDQYCADPERWGRSIFYWLTHVDCIAQRDILCKRGHFARWQKACRDGDKKGMDALDPVITGSSNREAQLEAYLNNDTDKLINCMVLTEGFDDPSLQSAWVRDSGRGPTMQMAGRAFRKFASLPVKNIIQSKMTKHPMLKTALPEQQYLWKGQEWRSLTVNPYLAEINGRARQAIATTEVSMPDFITKNAKGKRARQIRF